MHLLFLSKIDFCSFPKSQNYPLTFVTRFSTNLELISNFKVKISLFLNSAVTINCSFVINYLETFLLFHSSQFSKYLLAFLNYYILLESN